MNGILLAVAAFMGAAFAPQIALAAACRPDVFPQKQVFEDQFTSGSGQHYTILYYTEAPFHWCEFGNCGALDCGLHCNYTFFNIELHRKLIAGNGNTGKIVSTKEWQIAPNQGSSYQENCNSALKATIIPHANIYLSNYKSYQSDIVHDYYNVRSELK